MIGCVRRTSRQLALDLRAAPRWGGRREGAGRRPGPDSRIRHQPREDFAARFPCLVTLKTRSGLPSLRSIALVREVERSFAGACERGEFRVVEYSLQRDHLHLIVEAQGRIALARGMTSIAARLARAVNRVFARRGAVLADRYHSRVLRSPREVRNALAYVWLNTRRHLAKRLCVRSMPAARNLDPASSARSFSGWRPGTLARGVLPGPGSEMRPIASARTWLLRWGWRRHGLIDPSEVPGTSR